MIIGRAHPTRGFSRLQLSPLLCCIAVLLLFVFYCDISLMR